MKGFKTLFWLEYRRSGAWAVALIGSLAFWAWALFQARAVDPVELSSVRTVLLVIAAAVGALVPELMIGRLRGETRGGQYQVLLLTPPSGAAHICGPVRFRSWHGGRVLRHPRRPRLVGRGDGGSHG